MVRQRRRRHSPQRRWLVKEVRQAIVDGEFLAGGQLPSRVVLCERFVVSPVTLQHAIDELVADGYLTTSPGNGTFTSLWPPHRHRYVIVMPGTLAQMPTDAGILEPCLAEAAAAMHSPECQLSLYDRMSGHCDTPFYQQAVDDVRRQRLAGMIYVFNPWPLLATPLITDVRVPQVIIGSSAPLQAIPSLDCSVEHFVERAFEHLANQGRRRLAVVSSLLTDKAERFLRAAAKRYSLVLDEHALLVFQTSLDQRRLRGLASAIYWLFAQPRELRPDALLVMDSVFLPTVRSALADRCVKVPAELGLVAHCNYPCRMSQAENDCSFLGYSASELIRQALNLLALQQEGRAVDDVTPISPLFAHEIEYEDPSEKNPHETYKGALR